VITHNLDYPLTPGRGLTEDEIIKICETKQSPYFTIDCETEKPLTPDEYFELRRKVGTKQMIYC
jgi:hypothetical protein